MLIFRGQRRTVSGRGRTINHCCSYCAVRAESAGYLFLAWSRASTMVDAMVNSPVVTFSTKCRSAIISPRSSGDPRGLLMLIDILLDRETTRSRSGSKGENSHKWEGHTCSPLTFNRSTVYRIESNGAFQIGRSITSIGCSHHSNEAVGAGNCHGNARGCKSRQLSADHSASSLEKAKRSASRGCGARPGSSLFLPETSQPRTFYLH